MIKDFLTKLGANTKITVGVSVSPGLGLEMIEVDRVTKTVSKYGCKPLEYNYSTREIMNYEAFQEALEELFDELHIPRKSNIILSVPNIHFGIITLPLLLTDDAVTNAIASEVEQSYIFKRQEPVVSWMETTSNIDTENRTLAYSAIQQNALDGIKACCQEVGCTLVAVETAHASLFKALHYGELAKDQMKEGITWNLMIIGQNSYSIFSMSGKKIIDYYEEPLALKSFVDDEIYNAITTSAQLTLAGLPANYIYIVSETDAVSAEVLSLKIPFEGTLKFLECNKYAQNEIIPVNLNILPNLALKISPESIGSAIYPFSEYPMKFNLTGQEVSSAGAIESGEYPRVNIGNMEVELTPDFVKKICGIIAVALIVPAILIALALGAVISKEQLKVDALNTRIQQANADIAKYDKAGGSGAFDPTASIQTITTQNRTKLFYYSAIGMSTPNKLWVNYYMAAPGTGIDIKGKASDVESVYTFYKGIKQLVTNSDIRLYKLEVASDSVDDVIGGASDGPKYYEFEITNMTEEQLNPPKIDPATGQPVAPAQPGQPGQPAPGQPAPTQPGPGNPTAPQPTNKPAFGPSSSPSAPPASGDQLPKNLEKIEKF